MEIIRCTTRRPSRDAHPALEFVSVGALHRLQERTLEKNESTQRDRADEAEFHR